MTTMVFLCMFILNSVPDPRCCNPAFVSIAQNNGCWGPCVDPPIICDGYVTEDANPGVCQDADHGSCTCCTTVNLTVRKLNCIEDAAWCDVGLTQCSLVDSGTSAQVPVNQCNTSPCQ